MENNSKQRDVNFDNVKNSYLKGENISCTVVFNNLKPADEDWIGLYEDDSSSLDDRIAFCFVKDASVEISNDGESGTINTAFKGLSLQPKVSKKFHFKYLSSESDVLAESCSFEIEDGTISSESFLTIQATDSFDDTMILVNKLSSGKVTRMEEDFKKLYEQLIEAQKKMDDQKEYCESLERDIKTKAAECDEERDQRVSAEKAVEELGRGAADQMHVIEEQGQKLEALERQLSRETQLNMMLKEDMEGQRNVFEENSAQYDQLKIKAITLKTECKHAKKILQNERELFAEASARYEEEILHLKRKLQQTTSENNLKTQDAEFEILELEKQLELEKEESLGLRSDLKQISAEYAEYLSAADNEIQIAKEQIKDLELALKNEETKNLRTIKDHESSTADLQRVLDAEKKRGESLAAKYEEAQKRAAAAEDNAATLQGKLEEADRKMHEMEELVQGSKSELELLKKAVSVEEINIRKSTQSDSQITVKSDKQCSIERRSEMLLQKSSSETQSASKSQRKSRDLPGKSSSKSREDFRGNSKSKGEMSICSWERAKEHTIHREVFNNNNESRRYNPRFYEKRRFAEQEDAWYRDSQRSYGRDDYAFARPERHTGQLRQHRNSLLRENSRLRYTLSMLNHDCAILNYTLQQVVIEAEQKLEALYAMYLNKESQCAAYEAQMQGGLFVPDNTYGNAYPYSSGVVNQCEQYGVPNEEYAEECPSGTTSYIQTAAVYQANYPYCDGYFEVYPQQENFTGQPVIMEQMQYIQPVYVS